MQYEGIHLVWGEAADGTTARNHPLWVKTSASTKEIPLQLMTCLPTTFLIALGVAVASSLAYSKDKLAVFIPLRILVQRLPGLAWHTTMALTIVQERFGRR